MSFKNYFISKESSDPVLIPRRSKEERMEIRKKAALKQIQEYIKNGSQGDLDISGVPLTSLPDNLKQVNGNLTLDDTLIASLPDGLTVNGIFRFYRSPITSLPKGLKVGGDLSLDYSLINSLPEDLEVSGVLSLIKTPISKKYKRKQLEALFPGVQGGIRTSWVTW